MIEHAISTFEEINNIVSATPFPEEGISLYLVGWMGRWMGHMRTIRLNPQCDRVQLVRGNNDRGPYIILDIKRGGKVETCSFYLQGANYRLYTNYWHAYAHTLRKS